MTKEMPLTQLAFFINLQWVIIGPAATLIAVVNLFKQISVLLLWLIHFTQILDESSYCYG